MTRIRCTLALLLIAIIKAEASAQFPPPPVILVPQAGIGFQYSSGRVRFAGFIPYGSYGPLGYSAFDTRVIVTVPPPKAASERLRAPRSDDAYDVAGIDLDIESPSKIWGKKPVIAKNEPPANKVEVAKVAPPEPKKQVKPEVPPPPPQEKVDPRPLWHRLLDDGIAAFRAGEYGVALFRFRQIEADPAADRALFLQAQASIAVGKYLDAARLIREGLKTQPKWPTSGFQPKAELYADQEAIWKAHRQQLEQAQLNEPTDADFLFLLGYLAWFDGQREIAVIYFQQSRAQAADPRWADLFLQAGEGN